MNVRKVFMTDLGWGWGINTFRNAVTTTEKTVFSMEQAPVQDNRFETSQQIPPHFMESEYSLSHSQVPATCPNREPNRSNP